MDGPQKWEILRLHVEDRIPLASLARNTGIGTRTLSRWHAAYRVGGVKALERTPRADAGARRTTPELVAFVKHLALTKPRPSIATLHRLAAAEASRTGEKPPSYATVRSIVQALDPGMVTLALEGPASYRDRHELVFRHRAERPNALWQADHTELNILIKDPSGRPSRPWLTTVMDDYSRAICGYMVFEGAPSAMNTALALRQAIWPKSDPAWSMCGIPDVLYVDHGSDFTSHHLEYTAIALKIRIIHSTVARPQGRGKIERFFHTINTEVLATLPGHLTPGHPHAVPTLELTGLDRALGEFVGQYNERTHAAIRTSPKMAWIGEGWLPRMPESLEELDGLLLRVSKHRTVQRDGIHFQGQRYLSPTLASFVGRTVTIRYDPRDLSEIRVYDHDTFVCTAIDEAHPNQRYSLHDIETARRTRRRQLRKDINDRIPTTPRPPTDPPTPPAPARRPRKRLKTYEEDE
ncbi:Mu transposase C-terminal domain-containing protein [Brachybacterium sp. AOP3-A1-3]|uniref:Mu transposase C-terminal domain-containing protein n=1 Tax=Brachybacterium sp. AOP3-A1-3 TaxID=3457699 RepID=UPI004033EF78